jgi:dihydrodipicolinate synthase/N-acetylneuraminate lyase
MPREPLPKPLRGIVPPMLTPLADRDALDVPGLERLIDHILRGGVHGLFILGTTGEGPSLSYRLRRELVGRTVQQVAGRVPVLVGITDTAFVESLTLARHAAEVGADAVVLAPPYYMPEGQPELREFLGHLVPELPLPLYLYNMPPLTKVPFEVETVRWAMDQPGVLGLKDSSGDLGYFNRLCALLPARPDWALLIGPEQLLAQAMLAGGHGGVHGGANVFPRLHVALYEAAASGDFARARALQARVQTVSERLYHVGKHPSAVIKGIKCAASCLGICSDFMAEPFHRFRADERALVEQRLEPLYAAITALRLHRGEGA